MALSDIITNLGKDDDRSRYDPQNTNPGWLNRAATGPVSVTPEEAYNGVILSNLGAAGGVEFDLPSAKPGMHVTVVAEAAQVITVDPADADNFLGSSAGVALDNTGTGAIGDVLDLRCEVAGLWFVVNSIGTWA